MVIPVKDKMMNSPQVSIIIPVYNKEKYLNKTFESVKAQTFSDYEVIVVNDGSMDNSREIILHFQKDDQRIKLYDIPNGGVSNARNIGLSKAKGEWIQFLDGDDVIVEDYLERVLGEAKQDERIELVFTDFSMINGSDKIVNQISSAHKGIIGSKEICDVFMKIQEKTGFFGYISNKLFKRSLLQCFSPWFDSSIKLAEDLDFYSRLYTYVSYAYFSSFSSFFYLQTDENYVNDSEIDYLAQLRVRYSIKRWFLNKNQYDSYQIQLDKSISQYVFLVAFHDYEKGVSFFDDYEFITQNAEIMSSIIPETFKGFERKVLEAVSEKNYKKVKRLFQRRNFVRSIYRKVRR